MFSTEPRSSGRNELGGATSRYLRWRGQESVGGAPGSRSTNQSASAIEIAGSRYGFDLPRGWADAIVGTASMRTAASTNPDRMVPSTCFGARGSNRWGPPRTAVARFAFLELRIT